MKAPHFSSIAVTRFAANNVRRVTLLERHPENDDRKSPTKHRQFADGYAGLSPAAAELGRAIDQYKLENHRKYLSHEEMLTLIQQLGYSKSVGIRQSHSSLKSTLAE
jgi:hypothetical protein